MLGLPRQIAAARVQTCDRDILIKLFPVETDAADFDTRPRLRARAQQARKPGEWHAEGAAIQQRDPHRAIVKTDGRCRNGHRHSFSSQGSRAV